MNTSTLLRAAVVAVLLMGTSTLHAQEKKAANPLVGTWIKIGDPDATGDPEADAPLFFYGEQHWSMTSFEPNTGAVTYHHGGTYKLDGERYEETILFAAESTENMIGNKFRFKMTVDGDTMIKLGQGNPFNEKWKRVTKDMKLAQPKRDDVKFTEKELEAFVGEYDYGVATMEVTRKDKQLFAQLTGQPRFPIYPKSKTTFVWRVVKAKVEFVMNKDGEVIKGIHTQNGQTFDVAKLWRRRSFRSGRGYESSYGNPTRERGDIGTSHFLASRRWAATVVVRSLRELSVASRPAESLYLTGQRQVGAMPAWLSRGGQSFNGKPKATARLATPTPSACR